MDEHIEDVKWTDALLVTALGFVMTVGTVWAIWLDGRPFDELTRKVAWSAPLTLGFGLLVGGLLWLYGKYLERGVRIARQKRARGDQ